MNVLISATRQPFALDEIRKLGRSGHRVTALDSFEQAPGNHSRHLRRHVLTCAPRLDTPRFISDVRRVIVEDEIDLVLPTFEEGFYLACHSDELSPLCEVFTSPFETLVRLHHKGKFNELAGSLDLKVPRSTVVSDREGLREALADYPRYLARAVYSRGGTRLLTNVGAAAGVVELEDCHPSEDRPWIVQEFIDGEDLCTFSVARHGRLTAHVSYEVLMDLEHGSGIIIESVDAPESLEPVSRLIEALGLHGQFSFDFRRTPEGELVLIECNPRACNGVTLMPDEMFSEALWGDGGPRVLGAGHKRMLSLAVVRDMLLHPRHIPGALRHLLSAETRDVFHDHRDPLPGLYQLLTYGQVRRYRRWAGPQRDPRTDIVEAFSYDFAWDGQPIA